MRKIMAVVVLTIGLLGLTYGVTSVTAQQAGNFSPAAMPSAIASGDMKSVLYNWKWYMGMLRGYLDQGDLIATLEIWKSTGTIVVGGQPCALTNYRASINYQVGGMRAQYDCKLANGKTRHGIEVVSGQYAWDEDIVGAELVAGKGTATPKPNALDERLIRLWASPQGAAKAAGFSCTSCLDSWPSWAPAWERSGAGVVAKVAMEAGKPVVTYPIPGIHGAIAKATLNADNQAERIEVREGNVVTEFTYDKYEDCNPSDDRYEVFFPRHMVEKRNGVTVLDINVIETQVANIYVIMPVPESVKKADVGR
jgi:hypothetical protein